MAYKWHNSFSALVTLKNKKKIASVIPNLKSTVLIN